MMKNRLKFFGSYALFWFSYFILIKVLFLIYHFPQSKDLPFSDWFLILLHGSWLDMAMTGYTMLLPGLALVFLSRVSGKALTKVIGFYTILVLSVYSILAVIDYELYGHWGFRLDKTPILYIVTSASEVAGQTETWLFVRQLLLASGIIVVSLFAYFKFIKKRSAAITPSNWKMSIYFFIITCSLIIPIRGGFGVAPMNVGFVYFHKNIFANHAAINVIWNLAYSLLHINTIDYPKHFMNAEKTKSIFSDLYQDDGITLKILNSPKPNVIIIIVEGFTSKIIEPLGGMKGITPNFNRLTKEGILFSNIYASGDRTDKGVVAVISGYPAQPTSSIVKFPQKSQRLPFISKNFKKMGYFTAWTYGYNINHANFKSYLNLAEYEKITDKDDFNVADYINSKWGVDDHKVLERLLQQINNYDGDKPFFWTSLTLSSHEPFTVPMETVIHGTDDESLYLNSAYYTDKSLGAFIDSAKKEEWWKNTIVIITADHGNISPGQTYLAHDYRKFKIPILLIGGALAKRDTIIQTHGSQTDIANTLLSQLDVPDPQFKYSKNLLSNKVKQFAFYTFNNGFGFLSEKFRLCYDASGKQYIEKEGEWSGKDKETGEAYLQTLYTDFNNKETEGN